MTEREIQKILYGFSGGFFLAGTLMISLGNSGYSITIFGFTVLLLGMASVGPSTIKTLGAKWAGGHIGFDRYQSTEEERELVLKFAQDNPSAETEKAGEKFIQKAEARTPAQRSVEEYLALATEKWRAKDYDAALANVYAGLALNPKDVRIKATLIDRKGIIFYDLGLLDEATKHYKEAMILDSEFSWPHNGLGNVYSDQKKFKEAEAEYKKAMELGPNYSLPHYNLGVLYFDQGKLEEAEDEFNKAIALDPKLAHPHNGLGNVFSKKGKLEQGKIEYEEALKLKPDFTQAKDNLEMLKKEMEK